MALLGVWFFLPQPVSAATTSTSSSAITTGGDYDDLNGANQTTYNGTVSSFVTDGQYAYLYVSNRYYVPTWYTINVNGKSATLSFGDNGNIAWNSGQSTSFTVDGRDSGWNEIANVGQGTASYNTDGNLGYQLECRISLAALGATDTDSTVTINDTGNNLSSSPITSESSDLISPIDKVTDTDSTATGATTTDDQSSASSVVSSATSSASSNAVDQAISGSDTATSDGSLASNNNVNNSLNINIDGQFSDWDDITKTDMTEDGDDDNVKPSAMVTDDNNVYFYVSMTPVLSGGYTTFQASGYTLVINGQKYYVTLNNNSGLTLDDGKTQLVDVSIWDNDTNTNVDVGNTCGVTKETITQSMGDGSKVTGQAYVWEVKIPFSDLEKASGSKDMNLAGSTIKLENSTLWSGSLTATSASSGPVVLASVGFVIAGFSVYKLTKSGDKIFKRNKSEKN